jgi:carnitine 3-dehydrogenase
MSDNSFSPIAIIGTGTTGASWAAYYLARGLEVVAIDPAPTAFVEKRAAVLTGE